MTYFTDANAPAVLPDDDLDSVTGGCPIINDLNNHGFTAKKSSDDPDGNARLRASGGNTRG